MPSSPPTSSHGYVLIIPDLPQALDDLGGWTTRDCIEWFSEYSMLIADRYGDRVKRVAIFNEPSIFTLFGLGFGKDKRAVSSAALLHRSIHYVNLAHGAAVDILRARVVGSSIGAIHNYQPCLPSTPADAEAARSTGATDGKPAGQKRRAQRAT